MIQVLEITPKDFFQRDDVADMFTKVIRIQDPGQLKMEVMYISEEWTSGSDDDFANASVLSVVEEFFQRNVVELSAINSVGDTIVVLYVP